MSKRALVIDDSRAMRMILARILKENGYVQVEEGAHGREGLARLRAMEKPHLVLVDWNMPEMNGFEFLLAMRADAAFADVPVVMVTTEADEKHMVMALEAGASEYIMKPFTKEIVVDKLAMLESPL
jgi:two-component system chemotaxis response regulator CheY